MHRRAAAVLLCTAIIVGFVGIAAPSARAAGGPAATPVEVSVSGTPSQGPAPLQVAFQATVTSGTPTSYNWTFGDGTYLNGSNLSDARPSHVYTTPGTYTAGVEVWEGLLAGNASLPIHVTASALALRVTALPETGVAPLTVTFEGTVTGGSETYLAFNWTFGDGDTGSGPTVQYTYGRAGDYYAVLEVVDSESNVVRAGVWVNVSAADADAPTQVTGLGTLGWGIVGFSVGLVVAILVFPVRSWLAGSRPSRTGTPLPPELVAAVPPPSAPPPPPTPGAVDLPSPPSPGPPVETLRLSQRIVLHLATQGSPGPYDVAPPGATQAGMSTSLGVRQNALTNVLRRLIDGGVVEQEVRHVRGQPRRLKTYRLTSRGELLARELRHRPPRGGAE